MSDPRDELFKKTELLKEKAEEFQKQVMPEIKQTGKLTVKTKKPFNNMATDFQPELNSFKQSIDKIETFFTDNENEETPGINSTKQAIYAICTTFGKVTNAFQKGDYAAIPGIISKSEINLNTIKASCEHIVGPIKKLLTNLIDSAKSLFSKLGSFMKNLFSVPKHEPITHKRNIVTDSNGFNRYQPKMDNKQAKPKPGK